MNDALLNVYEIVTPRGVDPSIVSDVCEELNDAAPIDVAPPFERVSLFYAGSRLTGDDTVHGGAWVTLSRTATAADAEAMRATLEGRVESITHSLRRHVPGTITNARGESVATEGAPA